MILRRLLNLERELRNGTKKYNVLDIATKAWEGVKLLRELVNAEKKFFDQSSVGNISWNGAVIHLTNITQGDLSNQRNGKSVLLNGFLMRLLLRRNNRLLIRFVQE